MSEIAGYQDEAYVRGKAPMTKREIRILTIAFLNIQPEDVVVDIGAGTGGITMEAAHAAYRGKVYAVEGKEAAQALILQNKAHFDAAPVTLIAGQAPEALDQIPEMVDKIVVGGTGGEMAGIFDWAKTHLKQGGKINANFITLENAARARVLMSERFTDVEVVEIGVSRGRMVGGLTMMTAQNPVYRMTATQPSLSSAK